MSLTVQIRKEGKVAVLYLAGNLTLHTARLAREAIQEQMKEDTDSFRFELSGLDRIESAGLGELIRVYSSVRRRSFSARLSVMTYKFRELLQVARL